VRLVLLSIPSVVALAAAPAPKPPADQLEQIRALFDGTEPVKWATAIPVCLARASEEGDQGGPFHALIAEYLAKPDPVARRIAIVEGLLVGVDLKHPYRDAFSLLEQHLGDPSQEFREALRGAILRLMERDPDAREEKVAELAHRLAEVSDRVTPAAGRIPRHVRTVEDVAWILWGLDPARTVDALIEGLAAAERVDGDADLRREWSAPYHWVLRGYLFRRDETALAWQEWWEKTRPASFPAITLSHVQRSFFESKLVEEWESTNKLLWDGGKDDRYVSWLVRKLRAESAGIQILAARAAGMLAARIARDDSAKVLLEPLFGVLLGMATGADPYPFERPSVRAACVESLQGFLPFAGDARLVGGLRPLLASPFPAIVQGAVRTAGVLRIGALLPEVFAFLEAPPGLPQGPGSQKDVVIAIGEIGVPAGSIAPSPADVVRRLSDLLATASKASPASAGEGLAVECVNALGKLKESGELDTIRRILVDGVLRSPTISQDSTILSAAVLALGSLQDPAALPELAWVLKERPRFRQTTVVLAVKAIERIASKGSEAAVKALGCLVPHLASSDATVADEVAKTVVYLCQGAPDRVEIVLTELASLDAPAQIVKLYEVETISKVLALDGLATADDARIRQLWTSTKIVVLSYEKLERWGPGIELLDEVAAALKNGTSAKLRAVVPPDEVEDLKKTLRAKQDFAVALSAGEHEKAVAALVGLHTLDPKRHIEWAKGKIVRLAKGKAEIIGAILDGASVPDEIKREFLSLSPGT